MGSLSIWHWLIVLLVVGLAGIVPIFAANASKTLPRGPYAIRTLASYLAIFVMSTVTAAAGNAFLSIIELLINGVLGILIVLWSVHRVQDIGWSKWWCLLFFVPLVGIVFWFVLLFKMGEQRNARMVEAFD